MARPISGNADVIGIAFLTSIHGHTPGSATRLSFVSLISSLVAACHGMVRRKLRPCYPVRVGEIYAGAGPVALAPPPVSERGPTYART